MTNTTNVPAEGEIIYNQGYEFYATEVTVIDGILRYTGVCTDSPRNDGIRHTGYNGGRYGYKVTASS